MKKLEVHFSRSPGDDFLVGTLAEDRGRIYFQYVQEFLDAGWNLSPFKLPFESGLFEHKDLEFGPLPGLFDDSLPDGWGLLLMDRHFRSLGRNLNELGPLDRLAWLGSRTMGALTYHPPTERGNSEPHLFDLHNLSQQSQDILSGSAIDVLPELLQAGGSPGGARPKVLVGYNPNTDEIISGEDDLPEGFEHWIVKFFAKEDSPDSGAVEYAYSQMAAVARLEMPPTRLFETSQGDRFFGIKRFDRQGNRRFHIHTFGNLIHSNFRIPSADYADLLKVTSLLTRNHQDLLRTFRRMIFNILAHNRDDHVKNFAFILDDVSGEWTLSPAYDLVYAPGPGGWHTMTINGEGQNPRKEHVLSLANRLDISTKDVHSILEEVQEAVGKWSDLASEAGVSKANASEIMRSFSILE